MSSSARDPGHQEKCSSLLVQLAAMLVVAFQWNADVHFAQGWKSHKLWQTIAALQDTCLINKA